MMPLRLPEPYLGEEGQHQKTKGHQKHINEPDFKVGSVGLVGRRGFGIIFGMKEAGDAGALGAWDPKVGRASVEDDLEGLRGCADGNF